MTPNPSTTTTCTTEPDTATEPPAGAHPFARAYGPTDTWDAATCALYVELHTTPTTSTAGSSR